MQSNRSEESFHGHHDGEGPQKKTAAHRAAAHRGGGRAGALPARRGWRNGKARENRHAGRNERGAHRLPRELRLAGRAGAGQDPAGHRPG